MREKLDRLEHQLDIKWKQRAHVKWLQSGDRNTAFFHAYASERKRKNTIKRLKRDDGAWIEDSNQLKRYITNYFFSIFSASARDNNEDILQTVQPKVSAWMNDVLCSEYTEEEVINALKSIGDLKAPGPDGMPAVFFKKFWNTVGNQVTNEVLNVLRGGQIPEGWNNTMIVLIPKGANPEKMKDLRPISLCNVVYKLISKVITNRLKLILPEIISQNQSAFVPGRMISDNTIVAHELIHFLQRKRRGKKAYAAIKLDMSKAYDRVEWGFLHDMMIKLGFHRIWTELVMKCVTTVKYQIRLNGEVTETIIPERGLRQGDPLSPYLFLICAEVFSSMLLDAERKKKLRGIRVCNKAPSISHLLFADDSLLLIQANKESVQEVNRILNTYEASSGQMVNKEKSSIQFSRNARKEDKLDLMRQLNIQKEGFNGKYLGLPVFVGKSKTKAFQYLKERIWKILQGWKQRLLSKAGKEILIKAVAQAIPVYTMACFEITKTLCDEISALIGRYWWSSIDKDNKIHWVSWDKLSNPKKDGGMGFRDLYSFNLAMLAKQAWRLLKNPNSICAKILTAKYYPHGNILKAEERNGMSYC